MTIFEKKSKSSPFRAMFEEVKAIDPLSYIEVNVMKHWHS